MQITNLSVVTEAASEAAYLYTELAHMGADMRYLDCGGGLGIDYDGTASESHSSLPFSIQVSNGTLSVHCMQIIMPSHTEPLLTSCSSALVEVLNLSVTPFSMQCRLCHIP